MKPLFSIPPGMTLEEVALTFVAYLQGHRASSNNPVTQGGRRLLGPWKHEGIAENTGVEFWQLDPQNNFLLTLNKSGGTMSCRHNQDEPVVNAAITLFQIRYDCNPLP